MVGQQAQALLKPDVVYGHQAIKAWALCFKHQLQKEKWETTFVKQIMFL